MPDLNATCPSGLGCKDGQCAVKCRPGEVPCSGNFKCVNDFCVPLLCAGVTCPTDTKCDETTGKCVDVCAKVMCTAPKICQHGQCVDCNTLGCDPGQVCVAGRCQTDLCLNMTCPANQYCTDGNCTDLCTQDKCGANQRCVAGKCVDDKCANTPCGDGQFCDPSTGECQSDVCQTMQCAKGMRCVKTTGKCAPDPCLTTECPAPCWTCDTTAEGTAACQVSGDCREVVTKVGAKGGAGCSCALEPGDPSGLATPRGRAGLLALLALAWGLAARRRARS
jgi:hypothetical protein